MVRIKDGTKQIFHILMLGIQSHNEIMGLTTREEKIARRCAAKYNSFLIRKGKVLCWIGVVLFGLGILPFVTLPEWLKTVFSTIGALMIIYSILSDFIIVIGKLYEQRKESENQPKPR